MAYITVDLRHKVDLVLIHTVLLKPIIKSHSLVKMVSSGKSDVVITSIHSDKTHLKKLMIKIW